MAVYFILHAQRKCILIKPAISKCPFVKAVYSRGVEASLYRECPVYFQRTCLMRLNHEYNDIIIITMMEPSSLCSITAWILTISGQTKLTADGDREIHSLMWMKFCFSLFLSENPSSRLWHFGKQLGTICMTFMPIKDIELMASCMGREKRRWKRQMRKEET